MINCLLRMSHQLFLRYARASLLSPNGMAISSLLLSHLSHGQGFSLMRAKFPHLLHCSEAVFLVALSELKVIVSTAPKQHKTKQPARPHAAAPHRGTPLSRDAFPPMSLTRQSRWPASSSSFSSSSSPPAPPPPPPPSLALRGRRHAALTTLATHPHERAPGLPSSRRRLPQYRVSAPRLHTASFDEKQEGALL